MTTATVVPQAPTIPSKWDIVPIHASDRATFKFCRRQWAWSSPSKANLVPKSSVHGIREALWFGSGIHYALERYYNPILKEDPVTTFLTWFKLEWEGGLVNEDQVSRYVDREPTKQLVQQGNWVLDVKPAYRIKGLRDILPFPDEAEEKLMNLKEIGTGMMQFYKTYAEKNDNFEVLAVEHDFSVPILKPDGRPMYVVDDRPIPDDWEFTTDENYYGRLMYRAGPRGDTYKQVHARGRMDMVQRDLDSGKSGVMDYKTTSRLDDDYFRHLELDEQTTTYLTFGELEARMYGWEWDELEFINYQAMLKAYPKPPTITSRGVPSISRNDESTTAEMYEQLINSNPVFKAMFDADIKWQNYYTWLLEIGDKRFVHRKMMWRNPTQRKNAVTRLYYEALDMLGNPALYPNPTKNYSCLNCIFRAPCIAAEDGSDYEDMLRDGYMPNWDR